MKANRAVIALGLCLLIIMIGTTGYMLIDDYPFFDAVYMSVITITTVGYGEIRPLSAAGRIFTTGLILLGFGCLAFAGHALVESLLEGVWSGKSEKKKMQKKISELQSHYIICGFGRVGRAAAEQLAMNRTDLVILENSVEQVNNIKDAGFLYLEGDATSEELLMLAGIKKARGVLPLLASDPFNLFITLSARELNPTLQIIARSSSEVNAQKILKAGADDVVSPYSMAGKHIANDILLAAGKYSRLNRDISGKGSWRPKWVEVLSGSTMIGQNVGDISKDMGQQILGIRQGGSDCIEPEINRVIAVADQLLIIDAAPVGEGKKTQGRELEKLVIIDDNPVIRTLYARLFQKAGFLPLTAVDGQEGLDLILKEKPKAAVVDFKLPILSGIQVCRRVRESKQCPDIKMILFTADDAGKTRSEALDAGADEVIVKSAESKLIVDAVINHLAGSGVKAQA